MFIPGETILIETNYDKSGYIQSHFFVIALGPAKKSQLMIIIPINTIRGQNYDRQTILEIGSHAFIKQDSYVNYRRSRIISAVDLQGLLDGGRAKKREPCSRLILEKIRDGILKSAHTPMEVRELYESYLFDST